MNLKEHLHAGQVIPALPLALNADRKFDERRQRALVRYYLDAGAGGLAVAVHSTQFEIRDPEHQLLRPVLELANSVIREELAGSGRDFVQIAGICGGTQQALREAQQAVELGYHAGLLSLAALKTSTTEELLAHCRAVADIIPVVGFYLQPAAGGRLLPYEFWRQFAEIPNVVAIKMAPFNRYQTIDVIRGVVEAGRDDIALYTGNDDNIVVDLLTPFRFNVNGQAVERRVVGGLLGHWAVWTNGAVKMLEEIKEARQHGSIDAAWLARAIAVTDCNAAFFDTANNFHGCIPGIHEVLRRQGLLEGTWCLNPNEVLSPGQSEEIDRIYAAYPELNDDAFVKANLDKWLS